MGVVETSPSVPWRDGEGAHKLVGEPTPIASNGPRLGGSTHGYTSWGAPNADDARYVRVAPPRPAGILPMPAETNTPHAKRSCEKTLREHPRSCKASGARPAGPLARPHGIAPATRGKNVPSASVNICEILTDTPTDARGLLSGTAMRVPQTTRENPLTFIKTNANEPKNTCKLNPQGHGPRVNQPSHPQAELRFARGARCRTGTTPLLTVKIRQPSHEFTFGVGISFIPYPLVLTPVV
jgi:hypothetical protein